MSKSIHSTEVVYSTEVEQAIIGSILINNELIDNTVDLTDDDFYLTQHKIIFSAILTLVNNSKNADIITVSEALTDAQLNSCGGIAYIAELTKISSTLNFQHYFSILRNYTKARKINTIINYSLKDLSKLVFTDVNTSDHLVAKIETNLFKLYNKFHEKNRLSIPELIENFIVFFLEEEKSPFISTGFTDLDNKIGGLESEGITVVGACPAMGKTAWLMSLISYYIQEKTNQQNQKIKPIFIFSLEMDAQSLMMRIISILFEVSFIDIKNKYLDENDYSKITNAVNLLIRFKCANNQNALIIDDAHLTPAILRRKLQRYIRLYGSPEFVAIDFIQLMTLGTNHSENRAVELSAISRELKIQAKDFSIPLLLLAQLNRSSDTRPDKRPIMSDFKESGAIKQDATNVILLYREEVCNKNSDSKGIGEFIIAKARNASIGSVKVQFNGACMHYSNLVKEKMISN